MLTLKVVAYIKVALKLAQKRVPEENDRPAWARELCETILERFDKIDSRLDKIDSRLDKVESRFDDLR